VTGHASWGGSSGSSNKANTRRASGSGGYGWRTSSTGKNGDGKGAEKAGRSAGSAGGQAAMKKHVCRNPYVHQVNVCSRGKSAVEVEERCRRRAWPLSIFASRSRTRASFCMLACLLACWLIPISRFRVVFYGNQGTFIATCTRSKKLVPHRLHVDLAKVYILICRSTNIDCKI